MARKTTLEPAPLVVSLTSFIVDGRAVVEAERLRADDLLVKRFPLRFVDADASDPEIRSAALKLERSRPRRDRATEEAAQRQAARRRHERWERMRLGVKPETERRARRARFV
jgi:hypothetical protein